MALTPFRTSVKHLVNALGAHFYRRADPKVVIDQGGLDTHIIELRSSDVAHGITGHVNTHAYGSFLKSNAASGGLDMRGYSEATVATRVWGEATTESTTKSAAAAACVTLVAAKKSGTVVGAMGADANLVAINDYGSTRFIFDKEGEMHSDAIIGVGDDWDDWDDLALAADISRLPQAKFSEMMRYKARDFERAGLLTLSVDEEGNQHAYIKHKAMLMFTMCVFREIADRLSSLEERLDELQMLRAIPQPQLAAE